jgi:hypothetical protein
MGIFERSPAPAPAPSPASSFRRTLSEQEREALTKCEQAVTQGFQAFASAGRALALIRDKQLYRESASTFEEYVATRWRMSRQHAARLIEAAAVLENLSPMGSAPNSERIARPLAQLPPEQQREAWSEVVSNAPAGTDGTPVVTAAAVEAAVAKRTSKKKKRAKLAKPTRLKVPGATVIITPNKAFAGSVIEVLQAAIAKLSEQQPFEHREAA